MDSPQLTPIQTLRFPSLLDPGFSPAVFWNRAYRAQARVRAGHREVILAVIRPGGRGWFHSTRLLPDEPACAALNAHYCERLVKLFLWIWGGPEVVVWGAPDITRHLAATYHAQGARHFDHGFIGPKCFLHPLVVRDAAPGEALPEPVIPAAAAHNLEGCRIGFDLGGSDRKAAALIDGKVVFSEEIKWDPYFQKDPAYHLAGIRDSLERAARHLPRVDAIGGSAAGVFIANEPRASSLFRGLDEADMARTIRPFFAGLGREWGGIPVSVANDGDVAALAGAMSLGGNGVLGVSFGTSMAAGYITPDGCLTAGLNELAFSPTDYRADAPADEWSGDLGCGVQYFSQQAVARLLPASGIRIKAGLPLPARLELVQDRIDRGDVRAAAIFQTIGIYLGYSIPWWAEWFDFHHLLVMGRVSSGRGGDLLLEEARLILGAEFPEIAGKILLEVPDETMKRHGQAIAAASLPSRNA